MKYLKLTLLIILSLIFTACASTTIGKIKGKSSYKKYEDAYAKCGNSKEEQYLQKQINHYLKKEQIYGNALKIECNIKYYDEGNRLFRHFAPTGAMGVGAAKSKIKIILKNNFDFNIASFESSSEMKMGFLGGDAKGVLDESAKEITSYIKKSYIR
ncbi:hypothetical protein FPD38_03580 [Campylobacter volucris]|uniref:DUF4410 domain-containing protein n=1 Tax=Campylobacter volucris TaxID=1031542 RepID=A0A5C7E2E5_9BACT|nr:hypothetical protein [Campylobacter volucris]TXE88391.1 hypothetical protein FPD38_03580 [Campylobacter volucris]